MKNKQLIFAREFRGLTQTGLSSKIDGLSQSNLSRFEKGFETLSEELQKKIIDYLNFPVGFFDRRINSTIINANYRKKASIGKAHIQKFENKCKLIGYIVDEFSELVEWPEFKLNSINIEDGFTSSQAAAFTRKLMDIPKGEPVNDFFKLLESNGIITYEIDEIESFDGVSFLTDKGYPLIIINKNFTNDRKRFTLAHELGHIILHNYFDDFPISEFRNKEIEANEFASEFLMPESEIKNSLRNLKLADLGILKNRWLTSMASIIRRARDLKCIDENRYKYYLIEMSREGYTKKEPGNVFIDKPSLLRNAYNLMRSELSYQLEDFVHITDLPTEIINDIFSLDKVVKLKVV